MLSKIYDSILTLAYPQACQICQNSVENSSDGVACRACWTKTHIFSGAETSCAKCGAFLRPEPSEFETFCHRCDEHFYDAARAVGVYVKALSASVLHLKREPIVGRRLEKLFVARFLDSNFQDTTKIIPVPLSEKRFLERGFNQAAVLAKILVNRTGVAADEQSLVRRTHTPMHRVGMDEKARQTSVEKAFEVKRRKFVEGATILLIDDVFTSGATVSACARVLKQAGARKVYILTIARAAENF